MRKLMYLFPRKQGSFWDRHILDMTYKYTGNKARKKGTNNHGGNILEMNK